MFLGSRPVSGIPTTFAGALFPGAAAFVGAIFCCGRSADNPGILRRYLFCAGEFFHESAILCRYGRFRDWKPRARWLGGGSRERTYAVGDFWHLFLDHDFRDGAYGGDSGTSFDSRWLQSKLVLRLRLPDSRDEVPHNPVEKPGMAKSAWSATTVSMVVAGVASTGERGPYTLDVGSWS